jgi:acid phosphatase family membrane protein YuiD
MTQVLNDINHKLDSESSSSRKTQKRAITGRVEKKIVAGASIGCVCAGGQQLVYTTVAGSGGIRSN